MKTKLNSTILALVLGSSLSFFSCKNDTETVSLLANPSAAGFNQIRANALNDVTIKKTFKAEDGVEITTDKGTKIKILPNCLRDNSNNNVTGDVTLSFIEMYDRGNMVLTNKPLLGKDNLGNLLPLVSGGQFNIAINKGTDKLKSGCLFFVNILASNTGTLDNDMKLWNGNLDEDGNLAWDEVNREDAGGQGKEAGININTQSATYDVGHLNLAGPMWIGSIMILDQKLKSKLPYQKITICQMLLYTFLTKANEIY